MKPAKAIDTTNRTLSAALGLSDEKLEVFRLMRETLEADLMEEYDDTDSQVLQPVSIKPPARS